MGFFLNRYRQQRYIKSFSPVPLWIGAIAGFASYGLYVGVLRASPTEVNLVVALLFAVAGGVQVDFFVGYVIEEDRKKALAIPQQPQQHTRVVLDENDPKFKELLAANKIRRKNK